MNLEISNKTLLATILFGCSVSFATTFVSIVDSKSSGGIAIIEETAEIGTIVLWGDNNPPEGWLILNGQSTAGYPDLVELYGANIPDYSGAFIRGYGNGSAPLGVVQQDSVLEHNHSATFSGNPLPAHTHSYYRWTGAKEEEGHAGVMAKAQFSTYTSTAVSAGTPSGTVNVAHSGGVETRPTNISFNYIIKGE